MTRKEAIETAALVVAELNLKPYERGAHLGFEATIVSILIALGVLKVEDE